MKHHAHRIEVPTRGRSTIEITDEVQTAVADSGVQAGLCNVFVHHTSASLLITENADPDVRRDLERVFSDLAPDGDPRYVHTAEGPDDMSAHIRSALTRTSLNVPVLEGRCGLGTWQGIYLWEHRTHAHRRRVTITVMGNADDRG